MCSFVLCWLCYYHCYDYDNNDGNGSDYDVDGINKCNELKISVCKKLVNDFLSVMLMIISYSP